MVVGGRTGALAPTKRQFVLRWMTSGQACGSTVALGCFDPDGVTGPISGLLQLRSNATAQASGRLDDWAAVVAHEMIHGLGHGSDGSATPMDGARSPSHIIDQQLLRWAAGTAFAIRPAHRRRRALGAEDHKSQGPKM